MNEEMKQKIDSTLRHIINVVMPTESPNQKELVLIMAVAVIKKILSLETDEYRIAVIKKGEPPIVITPFYRGADPEIFALKAKQDQRSSDIEYYKGE